MIKKTTIAVDKNIWKEINKRKKIGETLNDVLIKIFNKLNHVTDPYVEPTDEERLIHCISKFDGKVSRTKIQQTIGWNSEKQKAVCEEAIKAGKVKRIIEPTRTKPRTVYVEAE